MADQPCQPFLFVPDLVIDRYHDDPLTVALYAGIARCCVAASGPVPLSAPDLAQWFSLTGEPGRVAIMRRIQRLVADGWLTATKATTGTKLVLAPTWGRSRDGEVRAWDWQQRDRGRPNWQRGRRVPLTLFDAYLGQLVPHPTTPADHPLWWDHPLLDGQDVGTWVIGLHRTVVWTPRLRHLGIVGTTLHTLDQLRAWRDSGTLTTLDNQGAVISVALSTHPPPESRRTRSRTRHAQPIMTGSDQHIDHDADTGASAAAACDPVPRVGSIPQIAWDSCNKLINTMNPPKSHDLVIGSGADRFGAEHQPATNPTERSSTPAPSPNLLSAREECHELDPQVAAGHGALNPGVAIPPGEWLELARLERQHGAAMLLIWQARATRRTQAASGRVVPAYYVTCAQRQAADAYQPPRYEPCRSAMPSDTAPAGQDAPETADPDRIPESRPSRCTSAAPAKPAIDPDADKLLRAMGLRSRSVLAGVPLELIRQWQPLIDHPALVARFPRDHRGWIWTQLREAMEPPSAEELANWLRATGRQEPTDWQAIAQTSGDLVRMGDDLDGLPDADLRRTTAPPDADLRRTTAPPPAPPMDELTRGDDECDTHPPIPPPTAASDLADQIRAEVRLRSSDRTLRQILDRTEILQRGEALLVRCATADLRLLLTHTAILRAAALGVNRCGPVQCVAF